MEPRLISFDQTPAKNINSEINKITLTATYEGGLKYEAEIFFRQDRSGYLTINGRLNSKNFLNFVIEKKAGNFYLELTADNWWIYSLYDLHEIAESA